jgi:uncharacterized protein (DUF58 family)
MLTKQSAKLIGAFVALFATGLWLGSVIFYAASFVPLFVMLFALLFEPSRNVSIKVVSELGNAFWVGEVLELSFEITIYDGLGTVICTQEPPREFEFVDGNNLRIVWKGFRRKTYIMSYRFKCSKAGTYILEQPKWESQHILGLRQGHQGTDSHAFEIVVKSPIRNAKVGQRVRTLAESPYQLTSAAKIGVVGTDFKEVRDYAYVDPIGSVNWTAPAARASRGLNWPLVNDYEVEGRKAVWLFVDASTMMKVGTNVANVFEYARQAAQVVSYFFISRGHKVGMYVYNSNGEPIYPDVGKRQFYRITQTLLSTQMMPGTEGLTGAVRNCAWYLNMYKPFTVVITKFDSTSISSLIEGLQMVIGIASRYRRKLPLLVVNVLGYDIIPASNSYDRNSITMMRWLNRPMRSKLKKLGVSLLEWDPGKQTFDAALLKTVRMRL